MPSDHDRAGGLGVVMSGGCVHSELGTPAGTQLQAPTHTSESHCFSAWYLENCHTVRSEASPRRTDVPFFIERQYTPAPVVSLSFATSSGWSVPVRAGLFCSGLVCPGLGCTGAVQSRENTVPAGLFCGYFLVFLCGGVHALAPGCLVAVALETVPTPGQVPGGAGLQL